MTASLSYGCPVDLYHLDLRANEGPLNHRHLIIYREEAKPHVDDPRALGERAARYFGVEGEWDRKLLISTFCRKQIEGVSSFLFTKENPIYGFAVCFDLNMYDFVFGSFKRKMEEYKVQVKQRTLRERAGASERDFDAKALTKYEKDPTIVALFNAETFRSVTEGNAEANLHLRTLEIL